MASNPATSRPVAVHLHPIQASRLTLACGAGTKQSGHLPTHPEFPQCSSASGCRRTQSPRKVLCGCKRKAAAPLCLQRAVWHPTSPWRASTWLHHQSSHHTAPAPRHRPECHNTSDGLSTTSPRYALPISGLESMPRLQPKSHWTQAEEKQQASAARLSGAECRRLG